MFAIQSEFARATVAAAKLRLVSDAPVVRRPTENMRAYDPYLTGRHFMNRLEFDKALDYFERSLQAGWAFVVATDYDAAIERFRRALALDPSNILASPMLARAYFEDLLRPRPLNQAPRPVQRLAVTAAALRLQGCRVLHSCAAR